MRQSTVAIEAAEALGLSVVTIHLSSAGFTPHEEHLERVIESIGDLARTAEAAEVMLGIENTAYPADPDEFEEILSRINHPAVGVTLDLGHVTYWLRRDGQASLPHDELVAVYMEHLLGFITRLADSIIHIHAHDVNAATLRDHREIGTGLIDFDAVFTALRGAKYDGMLEVELEESDVVGAATRSIERLARFASEEQRS